MGDLLVLARLGALVHGDEKLFPTAELKHETEASNTRIRNAMIRIAEVLGPVEVEGKQRRTQRPSAKGRNIGGAAVLANMLIEIAQEEQTDHDRLRHEIAQLIDRLENMRKAGSFRKSRTPPRF
ncbi:hypothetical protein [Devosia sp.]|uniref:hypothetical protein n=1 Tax=Devosia sp. TaxID=1871048 RepID=UPI003F703A51